jgi:hypothetical protein
MVKHGKIGWIPKVVIEELEEIKREEGLNFDDEGRYDAIAFRKLAQTSRNIRESQEKVRKEMQIAGNHYQNLLEKNEQRKKRGFIQDG